MPEAGDTKLSLGGIVTPTIGEDGVAVDLANLIYEGKVREWISPPNQWVSSSPTHDIVSINNLVLTIAPEHSTDTITYELDPYGLGHDHVFRATIPSLANFVGFTGYAWSLSMDITHGTNTFGEVTRSYTTTEQIGDAAGTPVAEMTFTTETSVPVKATNPTPEDVATDIPMSTVEITWEDGGGAETYDVYFGPDGDVSLVSEGQEETSWDLPVGVLEDYNTIYDWRIDSVNAAGTTTGDTWSFTTLVFAPPAPSGEGDGGEFGGEGGKNILRTVRRLLVAADNKIFYEDE